jgi:exodeoxyribonuclease VII large subunit
MDKKIFSVSEVANDLKVMMEDNFPFLWISGELSNAKRHSSGHFYFTLKDEAAQLSGVMWRSAASRLRFEPEDGMRVLVAGKLSFYPPQGKTQFYAEHLEPDGLGALQLAFEELKKKLEAEGLFAEARKRPLPLLPRKVGIITSETGAVIHDLVKNIRRRYPTMDIVFAPAKVQGAGAAEDIAAKIEWMNARADVDVLIVGRGGGSLEDLWAFNEEAIARAIAASRIPVVSAVGHESDFTIADFVADVRASTPTAAAEIAVPVYNDLLYTLEEGRERLLRAWTQVIRRYRERLRYCESHVRDPRQLFAANRTLVRYLAERLQAQWQATFRLRKERISMAAAKLGLLSPLSILDRGYAIVYAQKGRTPLKDAHNTRPGDTLEVQLARGRLHVAVKAN